MESERVSKQLFIKTHVLRGNTDTKIFIRHFTNAHFDSSLFRFAIKLLYVYFRLPINFVPVISRLPEQSTDLIAVCYFLF